MADNTSKVTIDAEWFIELYDRANDHDEETDSLLGEIVKERDELIKKLNNDAKDLLALTNERDELNAKLEELSKHDAIAISDSRLAAAERCIDDIEAAILEYETESQGSAVLKVIRAYREKKKAAR